MLIPQQCLYLAPLSSATGASSYGLGAEPLLVHTEEELAGSCSIGDVVEVTGAAYLQADAANGAGAARLQVCMMAAHDVVQWYCMIGGLVQGWSQRQCMML